MWLLGHKKSIVKIQESFRSIESIFSKTLSKLFRQTEPSLNQLIRERCDVLSQDIVKLTREISAIDRQYTEKLSILDQQGNLKSLKQTYAAFQAKADEASQLRAFIGRYEELETQKQEAKTKKEADLLQLQSDIQEAKGTLKSFEKTILDLHDFIQGNRKASFEIKQTSKKQVIEIVMRIDDDGSHSVEREKVFIYDLALLLNDHIAIRHPGILVHDNIFDVDQDTLIKSIEYRDGSVCLNSFEPFLKWVSRSVTPRPGLVAACCDMPDRASARPAMNAVSVCCRSSGIGRARFGRPTRCRRRADKPPHI